MNGEMSLLILTKAFNTFSWWFFSVNPELMIDSPHCPLLGDITRTPFPVPNPPDLRAPSLKGLELDSCGWQNTVQCPSSECDMVWPKQKWLSQMIWQPKKSGSEMNLSPVSSLSVPGHRLFSGDLGKAAIICPLAMECAQPWYPHDPDTLP